MKKNVKYRVNPLAIAAAVVLIVAVAVTLLPKLFDKGAAETAAPSGSDLIVNTDEIGNPASFFDYDADGITLQVRGANGLLADLLMLLMGICMLVGISMPSIRLLKFMQKGLATLRRHGSF